MTCPNLLNYHMASLAGICTKANNGIPGSNVVEIDSFRVRHLVIGK